MGIAGSLDIFHFQARISKLMAALEFVSAYIDDLLCIIKERKAWKTPLTN
jgi:hypothetical protein